MLCTQRKYLGANERERRRGIDSSGLVVYSSEGRGNRYDAISRDRVRNAFFPRPGVPVTRFLISLFPSWRAHARRISNQRITGRLFSMLLRKKDFDPPRETCSTRDRLGKYSFSLPRHRNESVQIVASRAYACTPLLFIHISLNSIGKLTGGVRNGGRLCVIYLNFFASM